MSTAAATPHGISADLMGATARGDVATGARAPRTYEKWDGANRFFLRGRLVSSGDNPLVLLIFSVVLLVLPPLWMGWEARYLLSLIHI